MCRAAKQALGIVYETDAKVEPGVKIVAAFPADLHPADRLSVCRDPQREAGGRGLSGLRALGGGESHLREIRLHAAGPTLLIKFSVFDFSRNSPLDGDRADDAGSPSLATLVATPIGIGLAWLLARSAFRGRLMVEALVHLPLVLPPVVTGYCCC